MALSDAVTLQGTPFFSDSGGDKGKCKHVHSRLRRLGLIGTDSIAVCFLDDVEEGLNLIVHDCETHEELLMRMQDVVRDTSESFDDLFQVETDLVKSLMGVRQFSFLIEVASAMSLYLAGTSSWSKLV